MNNKKYMFEKNERVNKPDVDMNCSVLQIKSNQSLTFLDCIPLLVLMLQKQWNYYYIYVYKIYLQTVAM